MAGDWRSFYSLAVISYLLCCTPADAHRSSGRLIIDTAKKAFEEATRRHRRDTLSTDESKPTLESLLLEDPSNAHLVEFDLIMDDDQFGTVKSVGGDEKDVGRRRSKRKALRHSIYHWPGATVPYIIHSSADAVSSQARYRIQKAMDHWHKHTCVKFVKYEPTKHSNYVVIKKGDWCASKLGMSGGAQPLYIALGCLDTGTIVHELGHTLGWVHEQARPDRDDYVTINWSMVSANYKSQYVKHSPEFINTYGVPYDYGSIMHYPSYGELITKDPSAQKKIGQRNRLSFNDMKLANVMYKCAARSGCDKYNVKCSDGGFVDRTCKCVCPDGGRTSCAASTGLARPSSTQRVGTTPPMKACNPWTMYDNAYIPGYNEDVGFSLTVEECQTRCMQEREFECRSFDYWKSRRQCYLSSVTAAALGVRLRRDSRMVHYTLTSCPSTKPTSTVYPGDQRVTRRPRQKPDGSNSVVTTRNPKTVGGKTGHTCPFESVSVGGNCVRAFDFPRRPVYIAHMDCQTKLRASLWSTRESFLSSPALTALIAENQEYWVKIENYKSKNRMAAFFDFCPYISKVNGEIVVKDTLCYKSKGFFCQL